ncbi:MAG: hypothetical protein IKK65_01145, partial [Clostridia bacterium]|nr:hypothetical protein [Clostridia bacterium]
MRNKIFKVLSVLLTLALVLSSVVCVASAAETSGKTTFVKVSEIETGKDYVIVNAATGTVLTNTIESGLHWYDGLGNQNHVLLGGELAADADTWSFVEYAGTDGYAMAHPDGGYLSPNTVNVHIAEMYEWITPVYVEYSAEEDGFQIYRKEGEGIYKLAACNDMSGNFIYAIGCNTTDFDAYSYWNIYEVVVEEEEPVVPNRKLVKVSEIETGKDYVIVNSTTGTVLTNTIESGYHWYDGLGSKNHVLLGSDPTPESDTWSFVEYAGTDGYAIAHPDGGYLSPNTVAVHIADMYEWITPVYVEYSAEADGFQIYRKEGNAIYKLVACNDLSGNYIYAIGCNKTDFDAYSYWNIYEIVEEAPAAPVKKLQKVSEIETGKDYVIVNSVTGTVLTNTIEKGYHWYDGLGEQNHVLLGGDPTPESDTWSFVEYAGTDGYAIAHPDGGYLSPNTVNVHIAEMYEWITPVYVEYSAEADGFQIYRKEGTGIYKLVACNDLSGNLVYAIGCNNSDFDANSYWNIYEIVEEAPVAPEGPAAPTKKLVRATEFELNKQYVIVNTKTGTALTKVMEKGKHWYGDLGDQNHMLLAEEGKVDSDTWSFVEYAGTDGYAIAHPDGGYLSPNTVNVHITEMYEWITPVYVEYNASRKAFQIYRKEGNGIYKLVACNDLDGNYVYAIGCNNNTFDKYSYWYLYEIVENDGTEPVSPDVIYPEMKQGNIDNGTIKPGVLTRYYTPKAYAISDVQKITVAKGYKIYINAYDAEDNWVSSFGWKEAKDAKLEITGGRLKNEAGNATHFRVVVATMRNDILTPDILSANAVNFTRAIEPVLPALELGAIDNGTINGGVNTSAYTSELYAFADFEKVIIADGYKAAYHFYDAEGNWLNSLNWEGTKNVSELTKVANEGATQFRVVVALADDAELSLETIPADVLKLIVVGSFGSCDQHIFNEYISNNDATCLEDGTKSAACAICGETTTVTDEFTAFGHSFAEGEDKCSVCGEQRIDPSACEHDYRQYISDENATCEEDGTKSAKCLICGNVDVVVEEGTALGHDADYVNNNDATCDTNATQTGVCTRCNQEVTIDVPNSALGHSFVSDDDDYCAVCGFERQKKEYFVYESKFGGADTNDGLTAETPVASVNKAIKLALEAGAGNGDLVIFNVAGNIAWGGVLDGNCEYLEPYDFKVIFRSEDGTGIVGDGINHMIIQGQMTFDNVLLYSDNWKVLMFEGHNTTFNQGFVGDMFDLNLGSNRFITINRPATFTLNAFTPKIWIANTYGTATFNGTYTLSLNSVLNNDIEDDRNVKLELGPANDFKTVFNAAANININIPSGIIFSGGNKVVIGEKGHFNIFNNCPELPISISEIGLTDEAIAKTWVLNVAPMATIESTDVAGEFDVAMGYIATATPVEGEAIKSVGGKLVIPAGEYSIAFEICQNHVYDNEYDPECNVCGAIREVEEPDCIHEWSEYVADGAADCTNNATETRTCALCGLTETREVPDTMLGHNYDDNGFCTVCGIYEVLDPTLVKIDGVWYYLEDGVKTNKTTLVKYSGKWFYLENGIWDAKITNTLVKYEGKWFYIKGGKWDSKV